MWLGVYVVHVVPVFRPFFVESTGSDLDRVFTAVVTLSLAVALIAPPPWLTADLVWDVVEYLPPLRIPDGVRRMWGACSQRSVPSGK